MEGDTGVRAIKRREEYRGWCLDDEEYEIVRKYRKPQIIKDEKERRLVRGLAQGGFMNLGIHVDQYHMLHETASLTPFGERVCGRERLLRNPVLRFFYWLAGQFA